MRRVEIIARFLVLALMSAGLAQPAQAQDDDFLQFVGDVGFGSPPGNTSNKYVLKWVKPMAAELYFSAKTSPEIVTSISGVFGEAQQASGLPAQFYRGTYNVMVLMADWKAGGLETAINTIAQFFETRGDALEFISRRKSGTKKCASKILLDKEGAIQGGLIVVDVGGDDLSLVKHCSARSVASLFGLGTFSVADDKPYPSIANNNLNAAGLTEYDKRFLRLLYNPSI
jgi:hypothetical protein